MAINTLPVQFRRNYKGQPFIGDLFTSTVDLNAWLTDPTRYAGQKAVLVEGGNVSEWILNAAEDTWIPTGGGSGAASTTYGTRMIENFEANDHTALNTSSAAIITADETTDIFDGAKSAKITQSSALATDWFETAQYDVNANIFKTRDVGIAFDYDLVSGLDDEYTVEVITFNGTIDTTLVLAAPELKAANNIFTTTISGGFAADVETVRIRIVTTVPNDLNEIIVDNFRLAVVASGGSSGSLAADINVLGVTQGSYNDGDTIPAGTDFEEIFNNMLQLIIPPTYFPPTLTLSGSGPLNVEAGTLITPTLTPTFTQNDAGASLNYELFKQAGSIFVNGTPVAHTDVAFTIGDENIIYNADLDHDEGPTKNDNAGNPDPTGKILAGTIVSNNVTYRGQRKAFYDVDGDIVNIRSNTRDTLNPSNGTVFNLSNETGGDVVIAYPDTLRDLTQASLTSSGFTFDILSEFVREADQLVNDASGANPINYKVFRYDPAANFTNADFTITI